jgi:regulator of replication initiation timing
MNNNQECIPKKKSELFQQFRAEEQKLNEKSREERPLPLDITEYLEESTPLQIHENFKRYKRDLAKYYDEEWTTGEEVNKSLIPKLKAYTVDTAQVVTSIYKSSDIIRTQGRAATELYEQLSTIQDGEIPQEQARQLLATTVENAKRLAIFAWYQAKQQDEEAKSYAIKALKLPSSLKHLENKPSGKKDAFSLEFIEQYNEATYQQRIIQAATGGNNNRGSYSNQWNSGRGGRGRGRGKNFYGGRGRGNSTPNSQYNNTHNQHQQPTYLPQTTNSDQKQ